jgi:hypothetical protein
MKLILAAMVVMFAAPALAQPRIERFAVIVGNNLGSPGDMPLRYAEADAARVHDALVELGDFSPLNSVLLRGRDAKQVRAALLAMNERIRELRETPDAQAVLFVYYSGHADASALHLQGTTLDIAELRQHARGSAANFRLVVLDACRSGALTRVKGGQRAPPFALPAFSDDPLPGDGFAFLTASSANEDAQESDELQGALFTHAFVAGLLGAADSDGDGAVVLDEAYRYAYQATLRETSRSFAGIQHPTFHYDLRGRGQVVLTRPGRHAASRASLGFPAGLAFLLFRDSAEGPVAVELRESAAPTRLNLPAGRYFVRARASDVMYEGMFQAEPGSSRLIDIGALTRIDYARLVRKHARSSRFAQGLELGPSLRSALPNADTPCLGAFVAYNLELSSFGLRARFGTCAGQLQSANLRAEMFAHQLMLDLHHAWDLAPFTLETGFGAGLSVFTQRFETRGTAPARTALAPSVSLGLRAQCDIAHGFYLGVGLAGETHFVPMRSSAGDRRLAVGFAVLTLLGVGKHF